MLDGRLFDKLVGLLFSYLFITITRFLQEYIARQVRNSSLPFGGVQVRDRTYLLRVSFTGIT